MIWQSKRICRIKTLQKSKHYIYLSLEKKAVTIKNKEKIDVCTYMFVDAWGAACHRHLQSIYLSPHSFQDALLTTSQC